MVPHCRKISKEMSIWKTSTVISHETTPGNCIPNIKDTKRKTNLNASVNQSVFWVFFSHDFWVSNWLVFLSNIMTNCSIRNVIKQCYTKMVLIPWALNYATENPSQHKKYPSSYHEEFQQICTLLFPPSLSYQLSFFLTLSRSQHLVMQH